MSRVDADKVREIVSIESSWLESINFSISSVSVRVNFYFRFYKDINNQWSIFAVCGIFRIII